MAVVSCRLVVDTLVLHYQAKETATAGSCGRTELLYICLYKYLCHYVDNFISMSLCVSPCFFWIFLPVKVKDNTSDLLITPTIIIMMIPITNQQHSPDWHVFWLTFLTGIYCNCTHNDYFLSSLLIYLEHTLSSAKSYSAHHLQMVVAFR